MTISRKHDMAYACFLVPWAAAVIGVIPNVVKISDANAAGIGFFVLIPLSMLALVTVPVGIFYSIVFWRDGVLPLLSIVTIGMMAIIFGTDLADYYGWLYAVLVMILEGSWFLLRRRKFKGNDNMNATTCQAGVPMP